MEMSSIEKQKKWDVAPQREKTDMYEIQLTMDYGWLVRAPGSKYARCPEFVHSE